MKSVYHVLTIVLFLFFMPQIYSTASFSRGIIQLISEWRDQVKIYTDRKTGFHYYPSFYVARPSEPPHRKPTVDTIVFPAVLNEPERPIFIYALPTKRTPLGQLPPGVDFPQFLVPKVEMANSLGSNEDIPVLPVRGVVPQLMNRDQDEDNEVKGVNQVIPDSPRPLFTPPPPIRRPSQSNTTSIPAKKPEDNSSKKYTTPPPIYRQPPTRFIPTGQTIISESSQDQIRITGGTPVRNLFPGNDPLKPQSSNKRSTTLISWEPSQQSITLPRTTGRQVQTTVASGWGKPNGRPKDQQSSNPTTARPRRTTTVMNVPKKLKGNPPSGQGQKPSVETKPREPVNEENLAMPVGEKSPSHDKTPPEEYEVLIEYFNKPFKHTTPAPILSD